LGVGTSMTQVVRYYKHKIFRFKAFGGCAGSLLVQRLKPLAQ
jgi:hypothetical protein